MKDSTGKHVRVGFTCSAFDLLHAGHVDMLRQAKDRCDYLIVGLHTNPQLDRSSKNKPIQSVFERYMQLRANKYVDEIIPYETERDLEDILSTLEIDIRILGQEYKDKQFTGHDICTHRNIEIFYNTRDHRFSSTDLRKRIAEAEAQKM